LSLLRQSKRFQPCSLFANGSSAGFVLGHSTVPGTLFLLETSFRSSPSVICSHQYILRSNHSQMRLAAGRAFKRGRALVTNNIRGRGSSNSMALELFYFFSSTLRNMVAAPRAVCMSASLRRQAWPRGSLIRSASCFENSKPPEPSRCGSGGAKASERRNCGHWRPADVTKRNAKSQKRWTSFETTDRYVIAITKFQNAFREVGP
jgi:hypothetical protein